MSGGVDSSVAAALLKQRGYEVIGLMLRLWSEPGAEGSNQCCTPDSMAQARRVAAILTSPSMPSTHRNPSTPMLFRYFIDGYAQKDSNPCLVCNRQVRWTFLLERSLAWAPVHGNRALCTRPANASGAFRAAQKHWTSQRSILRLARARSERLSHALFPLGPYTKVHVRELAHQFGLPVAERPEARIWCFLGRVDYRAFLQRNAPDVITPGADL